MKAIAIKTTTQRFRTAGRVARSGFTLLEMLVVLAISAILLTLIFAPVVQSFNLTNRARTQIESQASARELMSAVSRILTDAVFIYDNAQTPLNMWFADSAGNPYVTATQFTMVEYVSPARQQDQQPYFTIIDPATGKAKKVHPVIDPTTGQPIYGSDLPAGLSGYAVPLAPGRTIGRIFIGLVNNASAATNLTGPDGNPLDGMPKTVYGNSFEQPGTNNNNRYALYRAEVAVYVPDPTVAPDDTNVGKIPYIPDLRLFHTADGTKTGRFRPQDLHDPNFFYDSSPAGGSEAGAGTQTWAMPGAKPTGPGGTYTIADNWRAVSSPLISTDKADLVALDRNDDFSVKYDANGKPVVRPLVTFSPTFFQNDPGVPTSLSDTGNESPNPVPTTFTTQYTHWANPFRVIVYFNSAPLQVNANADPMASRPLDYFQFFANPDGSAKIVRVSAMPGTDPGDVSGNPDVGPNVDPTSGVFRNAPSTVQTAFSVDPDRGVINFSFPHWVYMKNGNNVVTDPVNNPAHPLRFSPADINANLTGLYGKRYLSVRENVPTTGWGSILQLNPTANASPVFLFRTNVGETPRIHIVPGSEKVFGPDQRPGTNYGWRVQYTRVSANAGSIGANEYKILYDDIRNAGAFIVDPNDPQPLNAPWRRIGYIEFNSEWDGSAGGNPPLGPNMADYGSGQNTVENPDPRVGNFRPNGLPQVKYVTATGQVVPSDPVEVSYSFQMNRPNDVVKADYLTRELMNVGMEVRLYDKATGRPQIISLTNKMKVRNLQR